MEGMCDLDDYPLPEPVERYLNNCADKTTSPAIKDCALRLLKSPCSRQSFASIADRLEGEHVERAEDILVLIADCALMAGSTDHNKIRQSAKALAAKKIKKTARNKEAENTGEGENGHSDLFQAAIDAAMEAANARAAVSDHLANGLDAGDLGDLFGDEHEGTFAALVKWAMEAQSTLNQGSGISTLRQEHSSVISKRKFTPWAVFYSDFTARLRNAIKGRRIAGSPSLTDPEIAGLAAAAIASVREKDRRPMSRTNETEDPRAQKIRTARSSKGLVNS